MTRPLHTIARDVINDWQRPYFGARPYLRALHDLNSIDDNYGLDDARMVVIYFLSNATTWRGPVAREIKKELKSLAGVK